MPQERPAAGIAMTEDDLALMKMVDTATFIRGRTYAKTGSVLTARWDAEHRHVQGEVEGSGHIPYTAQAWIERGPGTRLRSFTSSCSCPVGRDCKHGVALLLHGLAELEHSNRPSAWQLTLGGLLDDDANPRPTALTDEPTIGLLLEPVVTPLGGRSVRRRLAAKLAVPSRRGGWVKGEATWQALGTSWWGRQQPRQDRIELLRELAALDLHGLATYYGVNPPLYLDDLTPRMWTLLEQARALGIPLLTGHRGKDPVLLDSLRAELVVHVDPDEEYGDLMLSARVSTSDGDPVQLAEAVLLGTPAHGIAWWDSAATEADRPLRLTPFTHPVPAALRDLVDRPALRVPVEERELFLRDYLGPLTERTRVVVSDPELKVPEPLPAQLVLTLTPGADTVLDLLWSWRYSRGTIHREEPLWPIGLIGGTATGPSRRDATREQQVLEWLQPRVSPVPALLESADRLAPRTRLTGGASMRFLSDVLPDLEASPDVDVLVEGKAERLEQAVAAPVVTVTAEPSASSTDWLDLDVTITVDGQPVPFAELFVALARGETHLVLESGLWFPLDSPELAELAALIEEARALSDGGPKRARVSRYQVGLWDELERLGVLGAEAARWREALRALAHAEELPALDPPEGLQATLRPYQLAGFRWLAQLHAHDLGGVLADDMGLGKTVQAIALMLHAKAQAAQASETGALPGPFLVVAPASVVSNWISECERFAPSLDVRAISETQRRRGSTVAEAVAGADVVVTSYTLFRLEHDHYAALPWSGLLLDEAQFAKNPASRNYQGAKRMQVPFTLAMTGTPLENNLLELWSLLSLSAPGLFPNREGFEAHYRRPIEREHDADKLELLKRRVAPLMLRRTKEEVAGDLPAKQEQVLSLALAPAHRRLYETLLQRERQKVLGLLGDLDGNRFEIFRALTLLRQAALAGGLVGQEYGELPSAKLDAMMELVSEVASEGHRALVFSQFTRFLGMARERLEAAGIAHCYLDGSTRNRAEVIAQFREGDAPVFLISLKAGGFGLNLTEADYAVLLDPWWNPATENQAVDRIHRIGQTRKVMVYRLVAEDTIEDKVMALKARKAALFDSVLGEGGAGSGKLTAADIRAILD